ncbi:MAG: adrA 1, partial [Alphaproteobacteria bacterium]|nr:adrA 1 [Alphaproteobacteria bacterium]
MIPAPAKSPVFGSRVLGLFLIALLIIGITALGLYTSFGRIKSQQVMVNHTYEVMKEVSSVTSKLKDVHAAHRDYAITGKDEHLGLYQSSVDEVQSHIDKLEDLVSDNPNQMDRIKFFRQKSIKHLQALHANLQSLKQIVQTPEQQKAQKDIFAHINAGVNPQEVEDLHLVVHNMIKEEERLLALRQQAVNDAVDMTLLLGGAGLVACVILLLFVFGMMHNEASKRVKTEKSLQDALRRMHILSTENELISKMGDYFQSCRSSEEAYEIMRTNLPWLLPDSWGSVAIFNNSRNMIETKLSWGKPPSDLPDYTTDDCWALRLGHMHHVVPGGVEPVCSHVLNVPDGGYVCMPMQAHGDTLGVFYIAAPEDNQFDDYQRQKATTVSEQFSLALANLRLQEKLRQQSIRDPMTQMFNRRYMEETMEREIIRATASKSPLSVMMLDIDHFKRFNDTFGHDAGDALIIEFARLVLSKVRKEDIACRYGGEEFLIMMPGMKLDDARAWAEELSNAVRHLQVKMNGTSLGQITMSVGLAVLSLHGEKSAQLV